MGPGIFTKYSRQVLGGLLALFALVAAVLLYLRFRSPVGGESPYDDIFDQGKYGVEMTADEVMYTGQTAPVDRARNGSPVGVGAGNTGERCVALHAYAGEAYCLGLSRGGQVSQQRSLRYREGGGGTDLPLLCGRVLPAAAETGFLPDRVPVHDEGTDPGGHGLWQLCGGI